MDREWLDFVCYCKGMPTFLKRVYRDEEYLKSMIVECVKFYSEVNSITELLINYDTKGNGYEHRI